MRPGLASGRKVKLRRQCIDTDEPSVGPGFWRDGWMTMGMVEEVVQEQGGR